MDDYWQSFILVVYNLNLIPPNARSFWPHLSPHPSGNKDSFLHLKISFVINMNGFALCWYFQQPGCIKTLQPIHKPPMSLSKQLPQLERSTSTKCSMMESPRCGSLFAGTYCTLLYYLTLSQTELSSQAHLTLFLTITNNNIFQ